MTLEYIYETLLRHYSTHTLPIAELTPYLPPSLLRHYSHYGTFRGAISSVGWRKLVLSLSLSLPLPLSPSLSLSFSLSPLSLALSLSLLLSLLRARVPAQHTQVHKLRHGHVERRQHLAGAFPSRGGCALSLVQVSPV